MESESEISQHVSQQRRRFLLIRIPFMQGSTATTRHGVTRKRSTKRLKYTGNLFRKNLILYLRPLRSYVKEKNSIGRKFQSLAVRGKKTIDIETLVTSRNGGRKIMQSIRIRSRPPSRIRKWNQFR